MKLDPIAGFFWLPDRETERVPGQLQTNDAGALELATEEPFRPVHDANARCPQKPQRVIYGKSGSNLISLHRCSPRLPSGPIRRITWTCQFAFVGDGYQIEFPQNIKSADIYLEEMSNWLPKFFFGHGDELVGFERRLFESLKPAQIPAVWSYGPITLGGRVADQADQAPIQDTATTPVHDPFLRLDFDAPQPWEVVADAALSLQVLLTIGTGQATDIANISIVEAGPNETQVSVHSRPNLRRVGPSVRRGSLFSFIDFGGINVIARWMQNLRDQTVLRQALVTDRYREPAFSTDLTNHLLVACEVYLRHQAHLRGTRLGNLSLGKEVLRPLVANVDGPFARAVGDTGRWINKVENLRNNWGVVHYQQYGRQPAGDNNITPINWGLNLLLVLNLLDDCGFDDDGLEEIAGRMHPPERIVFE